MNARDTVAESSATSASQVSLFTWTTNTYW
jgi:hypothetical protein